MLDVVVLDKILDSAPMKRKTIAKSLGVGFSTFSQKANGHRKFTAEEAIQLAELLGLSLDDLKAIWGD